MCEFKFFVWCCSFRFASALAEGSGPCAAVFPCLPLPPLSSPLCGAFRGGGASIAPAGGAPQSGYGKRAATVLAASW